MNKLIELSRGWLLATDPDNTGKNTGMASAIPEGAKPAPVPGVIQQVFTSYHGVAWYYLSLTPDLILAKKDTERLYLHFGAVDYFSEIFVDGVKIGENEGAENEFYLDVTDTVKEGSLLAVRVINPKACESIDGFEMITTPHRNKGDGPFLPGCCYNTGGITLPVTLELRSAVRVEDCFVRANWQSGEVDLQIELVNLTSQGKSVSLFSAVRPADSKLNCVEDITSLTVAPGSSVIHVKMTVPAFKLWDIDSPNLYDLVLACAASDSEPAYYTTHFGFRDFRLVDGYFHLNGRRIFLKSSHTGNHMPEGLALPAPATPELEYKDFQLSKAAGFNCIRFIATQATPRQLDYCDRLGLMIYQETYASWLLGDSDQAKRRYDESILAEIKRDRNHPSLTIWGMLNETVISDAHYAARDILPRVRELDDTRLCIFSSGRFDIRHSMYPGKDDFFPDLTLGSAANPESSVWENVWGQDGENFADICDPELTKKYPFGYRFYTGDLHEYPAYPHAPHVIEGLRNYGHNTRPVFISEYGVGSHLNVIEHCNEYERIGTDPTAPDYLLMASIRDRYLKDFYRYGFDNTYADPVDHLRDSEKYNAISRRDGFDIVRSNPKFCGYNLTGLLDHAICGEGPYTLFRRVKPQNFDALQEGWAPLRWCLFFHVNGQVATGCHIYSDMPLELEAVLADEDQLRDGTYNAVFAIVDETGTPMYRTETSFLVPSLFDKGIRKLAYPVWRQTLNLNLKPGKYSFRAYLKNGGCAVASEKEFTVSARPTDTVNKKVALFGLPDSVEKLITAHGATIVADMKEADVILAGNIDGETGKAIIAATEQGARTVFIDPHMLRSTENEVGYRDFLPLPDYRAEYQPIWLYHTEGAVKVDPFTEGMKTGFLDWGWYYGTCPAVGFSTSREADRVTAVHFYIGGPGEYHSTLTLATYKQGKGELVLSTFPICPVLTTSPAADRLLLNLLTK